MLDFLFHSPDFGFTSNKILPKVATLLVRNHFQPTSEIHLLFYCQYKKNTFCTNNTVFNIGFINIIEQTGFISQLDKAAATPQ